MSLVARLRSFAAVVGDVDVPWIVREMVGPATRDFARAEDHRFGDVVLELNHVRLPRRNAPGWQVDDVALSLRRGEIVGAPVELVAIRIEGDALHDVRMKGQRLALVEDQVPLFVESDGGLAAEAQFAAVSDRLQQGGYGVHVDGLRLVSLEAEQHRLVAAMSLAGGAERAVELHFHAGAAPEQTGVLQS